MTFNVSAISDTLTFVCIISRVSYAFLYALIFGDGRVGGGVTGGVTQCLATKKESVGQTPVSQYIPLVAFHITQSHSHTVTQPLISSTVPPVTSPTMPWGAPFQCLGSSALAGER